MRDLEDKSQGKLYTVLQFSLMTCEVMSGVLKHYFGFSLDRL